MGALTNLSSCSEPPRAGLRRKHSKQKESTPVAAAQTAILEQSKTASPALRTQPGRHTTRALTVPRNRAARVLPTFASEQRDSPR